MSGTVLISNAHSNKLPYILFITIDSIVSIGTLGIGVFDCR